MALGAIATTAFVVVACGSSKDSTFGDDAGSGSSSGFVGEGGIIGSGGEPDAGDTYANDPPPQYCVLPGQATPPKPGGTEQCPDDKNLPGCGCDTVGKTAPCWTGKRVNRGLGQCKDGTTTCTRTGEVSLAWGECKGEVLPAPGQTKGKTACKCFSEGQWKIGNLSPCFITYGGTGAGTYAVSTIPDGTTGNAACPSPAAGSMPPPAKPVQDWSTDSLKVDCAGHFKLCYELKAGNYDAPSPSDCSLTKVCVEADYPAENTEQPFPNLPAWTSNDAACAAKWNASGGYGEMSVVGESVLCDKIDDGAGSSYVFNRVRYCPSSCNTNPGAPECASCQQGGSGTF
ncbi:MAG: hypothetical protein JWP97_6247 [Labilithrix sp.]|nr:hypothetical protein [Labilithrix sp.]